MHGPCEEASQYALRDIIRQLLVGCQEDDNSEWVAEESSVWDKTQHKTLAAMLTGEDDTLGSQGNHNEWDKHGTRRDNFVGNIACVLTKVTVGAVMGLS